MIPLFIQQILIEQDYVPGIVLGREESAVKKGHKAPIFVGLTF